MCSDLQSQTGGTCMLINSHRVAAARLPCNDKAPWPLL
jgi:hypothetical protein